MLGVRVQVSAKATKHEASVEANIITQCCTNTGTIKRSISQKKLRITFYQPLWIVKKASARTVSQSMALKSFWLFNQKQLTKLHLLPSCFHLLFTSRGFWRIGMEY